MSSDNDHSPATVAAAPLMNFDSDSVSCSSDVAVGTTTSTSASDGSMPPYVHSPRVARAPSKSTDLDSHINDDDEDEESSSDSSGASESSADTDSSSSSDDVSNSGDDVVRIGETEEVSANGEEDISSESESDDDDVSGCLDASPELSSPEPLVDEEADLFFRSRKASKACERMMSHVNEIYQKEDISDATIPDEFDPDDIPDFQPSSSTSSASKRKISELMNTSFDSNDAQEFQMKRAKLFDDVCTGISSDSEEESTACKTHALNSSKDDDDEYDVNSGTGI